MNYEEEFELRTFGHVITCPGVYQAVATAKDGGWAGKWAAFYFDENGLRSGRSVGHDTERAARQDFWDHECRGDRFWWEKWLWMRDGDRYTGRRAFGQPAPVLAPGARNVLRINGVHYVANNVDRVTPGPTHLLGFSGHTFRWRWLDEQPGTVHSSNNVYFQGNIPAKMRHILPDNAEFITAAEPERNILIPEPEGHPHV